MDNAQFTELREVYQSLIAAQSSQFAILETAIFGFVAIFLAYNLYISNQKIKATVKKEFNKYSEEFRTATSKWLEELITERVNQHFESIDKRMTLLEADIYRTFGLLAADKGLDSVVVDRWFGALERYIPNNEDSLVRTSCAMLIQTLIKIKNEKRFLQPTNKDYFLNIVAKIPETLGPEKEQMVSLISELTDTRSNQPNAIPEIQ